MIYTIGHSTHSTEEFLSLLAAYGVRQVADVRAAPKSRRNPQFWADSMRLWLAGAGVEYGPFPELGGLRRPRADSVNTAWRNENFRGYADYMQTAAFAEGVDRLEAAAGGRVTVIMCAEAVPWRCHRSLIGDELLRRGWEVRDIFSETKATPHKMTPFAKVVGDGIVYPSA